MRRLCVVLLAVSLGLAACGTEESEEDGAGACLESGSGYSWCHDFRDDSDETGEQICTRVGGDFTAGQDCEGMGYSRSCSDGSWVKPGGTCF